MKRNILLSLVVAFTLATAWTERAYGAQSHEFVANSSDSVMTGKSSSLSRQSVGLVLSGGGAKGIAHIGVIKALEENDIPIDYITGTSMGAIVGGLYACGYTPEEMMELLLSRGFSYWSTGRIDPGMEYYFTRESASPMMLAIPVASKRDSIQQARSAVPASLISPLPMSFAFMELFAPYTAQCGSDFNNLFVPFRCVASDAAAKHKVVLSQGSLGDAIRSSMSFPIVFQPTRFDGMLLYDGGIYDNFPVDVMIKDFAPDIMIGVDVSASAKGPQTSLMDQIDNLVTQANDYSLPDSLGIKMRVDLDRFALLDFPKAKAIYKIGYDRAMEMMDSIKTRVGSRISPLSRSQRRAAFKASTPAVRFDDVKVHGGTDRQNAYIRYLFTGASDRPDTISIDQARSSFYRAISPGRLRDLTPQAQYDPSSGLFSLDMRASVKDNFRLGLGGYITSSASSYLYLTARYSTLSFSSLAVRTGIWIGQSYLGAQVEGRLYLRTPVPSAIEIEGVAYRQSFYDSDVLFFEDKQPTFIADHEYFGRLRWSMAARRPGKIDFGVGVGHIYDSFFSSTSDYGSSSLRDRNKLTLSQAYIRYSSNNLDNINFPTMGHSVDVCAMGVLGKADETHGDQLLPPWSDNVRWLQLGASTRSYISPSRHFSLGLESDVILSTRKLMQGYDASLVAAPAFMPTPSLRNYYNPAFQANSYAAAGAVPVWKINSNLSARIAAYCFLPLRKILNDGTGRARYSSRWVSDPEFFGEADVCYSFPFGTLTAYCNYASSPARNWNCGISFGLYVLAPKFLR